MRHVDCVPHLHLAISEITLVPVDIDIKTLLILKFLLPCGLLASIKYHHAWHDNTHTGLSLGCTAVVNAVLIHLKEGANTTTLNLAEVQVFDVNGNLIPKKQLTFILSTTAVAGDGTTTLSGDKCNDGDVIGAFTDRCQTAPEDINPSLTVLYKSNANDPPAVGKIMLVNPADCSICPQSMTNFLVDTFSGAAWTGSPRGQPISSQPISQDTISQSVDPYAPGKRVLASK